MTSLKKDYKPGAQSSKTIVNGYTLIAFIYCVSFSMLFYTIVENKFLAIVHLFAAIIVTINYLVLLQTQHFERAANITLATGTFVVLALFATGGWANTGYLWSFAYLPFVFFLTMGRSTFLWVLIHAGGCVLIVILQASGILSTPYSVTAIFNFFAALAVFIVCIFISTTEIIRQKEEIQEQAENLLLINGELNSKNEEVTAQAKNLKNITVELTALYSGIKESIYAAQVTQQSILPSEKLIKQFLSESFIFYKPKNVVGGDFYWFGVKEDSIIIAAVDCTGHGVSGALMSITGYHLLNNAVHSHGNFFAAEILDRLDKSIMEELHQHNENDVTKHGMDIALCIIDRSRNKLQFAGANSPLYLIRDKNLTQIKANQVSIGSSKNIANYTNTDIDTYAGDSFYIFSNGFADQLGGDDKNEKFKYPRFRELLCSIHAETMDNQLIMIEYSHLNWKKEVDQLDDILVIGFKI